MHKQNVRPTVGVKAVTGERLAEFVQCDLGISKSLARLMISTMAKGIAELVLSDKEVVVRNFGRFIPVKAKTRGHANKAQKEYVGIKCRIYKFNELQNLPSFAENYRSEYFCHFTKEVNDWFCKRIGGKFTSLAMEGEFESLNQPFDRVMTLIACLTYEEGSVNLAGLGAMDSYRAAPMTIKSIHTGKDITIDARLVTRFAPSKAVRKYLNN